MNKNALLLLILGVGAYVLYNRQKLASGAAAGAQSLIPAVDRAASSIYNAGATLVTGETRGIRNNNPGNLMANPGFTWQGQVGQDAGGYCIFDTPINGLRALALDLKNTYLRNGLNTIAAIITHYAPPNANPTAAYIADVSKWTGIPANTPFDVAANLQPVVTAITRQENGQVPYSEQEIALACSEALAA